MKTLLIICSAILQVLLLGFMAGQREHVLHTGRTIYLRTTPVDPRDLFRGDYVRLNYEISSIEKTLYKGNLAVKRNYDWSDRKFRDKPIYVVLKLDKDNLASVDYATDTKPSSDKIFIRGRRGFDFGDKFISIKYGLESYFVEQGKGRELENMNRGQARISLEMEAALGKNGIAVLKGLRTSPLNIKAQKIERDKRKILNCEIALTNISEKPVAIIDLPGYSSLKMETGGSFFGLPNVSKSEPNFSEISDKDVHILQPKETYTFALDFNDPYWAIEKPKEDPNDTRAQKDDFERDYREMFGMMSISYEPPPAELCTHLKNADLLWHGKLTTGNLDSYDSERRFPGFMP